MKTHRIAAGLIAITLLGGACSANAPGDGPASAGVVLESALKDHQAGKVESARLMYHKVLSLDPDNKFAYYNLGLIAQQSDRAPLAEAFYRATLTFDDKYWPALYNLALLKGTAAGGRREAEILYRKVLVENPTYAPAYLNLGLLLQVLGRSDEAEAMVKRAVELDPALKSVSPSPSPASS